MAKVILTADDSTGDLKITVEYDPPIRKGQKTVTAAQGFGLELCKALFDNIASGAGDVIDDWVDDDS